MKFGKRLKQQIQETLPEWRDKFLSYKELKKLVRPISSAPCSRREELGFSKVEVEFVYLLNKEIEKFNGFFLEKEEDFIIKHTVSSSSNFLSLLTLLGVCLVQLNGIETVRIEYESGWSRSVRVWIEINVTKYIVLPGEYMSWLNLQELKQRIQRVNDSWGQNGSQPSEKLYKEEMALIRRDIVDFHGEMVLLMNYSNINYTGA